MKKICIIFLICIMTVFCLGCYACFSSEPRPNNDSVYVTSENEDGTLTFVRYRGEYQNSIFNIPESINGINITAINSFAFSEQNNIVEIQIPKSVKKIGSYAFVGMTNLTTITFAGSGNNQLESIGVGAFTGCTNLNNFNDSQNTLNLEIDSLNTVSDNAFYSTAFATVELGQSVNSIGEGAFNCGSQLTQINVNSQNLVYASQDGVLMNKAKTEILQYPQGKTSTSYSVPQTVTEIEPMAFSNNTFLTQITLNNVNMIRDFAFMGCENLSVINTNNLEFIKECALDGTEWLEDQNAEQVILGKVYLKYQGTATELSIEGITYIAPMAFADNETIETITLNNGLKSIGTGAFYKCSNLKNIYICNTESLIYVSDVSFDLNSDNRKIYVPNILLDQYMSDEVWQRYDEDIGVHQTTINYVTNGGSACASNTVGYQDYLSLPTTTKTGYVFDGWYDNPDFEGQAMNEQTLWDSLDDSKTFYAKWKIREYLINLHTNGGELTQSYMYFTINDSVTLPRLERIGYTFEGWYEKEDFSGNVITEIPVGSYGDRQYYAKWTAKEYLVTLNSGYEGAQSRTEYVEYGKREIITVPQRTGYTFVGWAYSGELITDENGLLFDEWTFTVQVELVAQWSTKTKIF